VFGTTASIAAADVAASDKQGDGAKLATAGTATPGRCVEWDANGKLVSASTACVTSSTRTQWEYFPIAGVANTTLSSPWTSPSTGGPTISSNGSSPRYAYANFAESATATYHLWTRVPSNWDGSTSPDVKVQSMSASNTTASNHRLAFSTGCPADISSPQSVSLSTAQPLLIAASTGGVSARLNAPTTLSGLTMTGCSAGRLLLIQLVRDPANAADTATVDFWLLGAEIKWTVRD
jgi:hypothetical protein